MLNWLAAASFTMLISAKLFIYFILLFKSYAKYKKKIQQLYKNKHTKLQKEKFSRPTYS